MSSNRAFTYNSIPIGLPIIGENISTQPAPYPATTPCPPSGLVLKNLYSSIDPYHRSRMRPTHIKSYQPALTPGDPLIARSIATVQQSLTPSFQQGDIVIGPLPIQEYVTIAPAQLATIKKIENPSAIPDLRIHLSALGIPGLTAYGGLFEIGKPVAGETIFVSAASGAVGSIVGQLAKLHGLRVLGAVGSEAKLTYIIEELGFDGGFNYKVEKPARALKRLAPGGVDIYFDNVGGEILDAAVGRMRDWGRVVMCGTIAEYNNCYDGDDGDEGDEEEVEEVGCVNGENGVRKEKEKEKPYPLRSYGCIFSRRLTVRGFIVSDANIAPKYAAEHQERMQKWVDEGKIKVKTWEVEGIERAPEAFLSLFTGGNFGKTVLKF
ncbi:MAG: hypothetical protein Q9169_008474 [Polycauliona sp. 2 TL-2023]